MSTGAGGTKVALKQKSRLLLACQGELDAECLKTKLADTEDSLQTSGTTTQCICMSRTTALHAPTV